MKKYTLMKLKEYNEAYTGEREPISIHTNHKGSLIKLSTDQNINMLGIVDFKIGKPPRGNHYHAIKDEYFYILEGKVLGYFNDIETQEVEEIIIEKGTLIHIEPGCAHAFIALENGYGIEYSSNLSDEIISDSYYKDLV